MKLRTWSWGYIVSVLLTRWFVTMASAQGSVVINGGFDIPVGQSYSIAPWVQTKTLLLTAGGCQTANGPNAIGIISGLFYQDVPTSPGESYLLTFYVAGWAPDGPLPFTHNLSVDWGSQHVGTTSFDSTGRTFRNMGWLQEQFEVQATGNLMRLAFSNPNSISNPNIPLLDAVSLVPVPEPAPGVLMILASVVILVVKRSAKLSIF